MNSICTLIRMSGNYSKEDYLKTIEDHSNPVFVVPKSYYDLHNKDVNWILERLVKKYKVSEQIQKCSEMGCRFYVYYITRDGIGLSEIESIWVDTCYQCKLFLKRT